MRYSHYYFVFILLTASVQLSYATEPGNHVYGSLTLQDHLPQDSNPSLAEVVQINKTGKPGDSEGAAIIESRVIPFNGNRAHIQRVFQSPGLFMAPDSGYSDGGEDNPVDTTIKEHSTPTLVANWIVPVTVTLALGGVTYMLYSTRSR